MTQYGIEEFVILLKDVGREKAIEVDEQIRKDIEDHICELTQSIQVDDSASVKVTASFEVGAYPDNCLNVYDLIRLADDMMSTKSKQGEQNHENEYENHVTFGMN